MQTFGVLRSRSLRLVIGKKKMRGSGRVTTTINAAVIGGPEDELVNEPWVIEI